jgi:hypothetical protein
VNILITTPIQRAPNGSAFLFHAAAKSHHSLHWRGQLDYYSPASVDGDNPVTSKYQQARKVFLVGDYDALLTLESDMIAPPDTLDRLTALDCDLAYGLYAFRLPPHEWSAFTELRTNKGVSISTQPDTARSQFGQVIPVAGVGLGCTLIRRHVLEALDFRAAYGADCDWSLAIDAQHYGLKQFCDTGLVCGHVDRDGKTVYTPDPNEAGLFRVETI